MPCTSFSFQFFKKNIEDCCVKLKNHTYKVGRESSTKVYLRHQYLRGTHNNKEWLAEEEKKPGVLLQMSREESILRNEELSE